MKFREVPSLALQPSPAQSMVSLESGGYQFMIITPLVLVPLNQFYIEIKSYKTLTVKLNIRTLHCEQAGAEQVDDLGF